MADQETMELETTETGTDVQVEESIQETEQATEAYEAEATEAQESGAFEIEYDDGSRELVTPERYMELKEAEEKLRIANKEKGEAQNTIGKLRKQLRGGGQQQEATQTKTQNRLTADQVDWDDPEDIQRYMVQQEQGQIGLTPQQQAQQVLLYAQGLKVVDANPELFVGMTPEEALDRVGSIAKGAYEIGISFEDGLEIAKNGGKPAPSNANKAVKKIVKAIQSNGGPVVGVGATSGGTDSVFEQFDAIKGKTHADTQRLQAKFVAELKTKDPQKYEKILQGG